MVTGRRAGLGLEEVVVDDVERRDAERDPRKTRLRSESRPDPSGDGPPGFGNGMRRGSQAGALYDVGVGVAGPVPPAPVSSGSRGFRAPK